METTEKEYMDFITSNEVENDKLLRYKESKDTIVVPSKIKSLSNYAFRNNFKAKKILLSPMLKEIEDGEIQEAMTIEERDSFVGCFSGCINLKQIVLSKKLDRLPACVFSNCATLEKVFVQSDLKEIDKMAFYGCASLQEINLPNSLEMIKMYAFYNCISLKVLFIPKSVKYIGKYAFSGMTSAQTLVFECKEEEQQNFHWSWKEGAECKVIWNYSLRK
ncbi:MAG: leucine-rich repeat domain-containing protein [Clostridia bacterium]|nr:leucine-rich repeat domain-containing protein [Clostridia bacterium]